MMYSEVIPKYSERMVEIVPDLLGSPMSADRPMEEKDIAYTRADSSASYPPHYPELWRDNPPYKSALGAVPAGSPGPGGMPGPDPATRSPPAPDCTGFPMSSLELEPLSGVFSFTSGYKEFPVFKEKVGHDSYPIADALLSLKHAVVHPSQISGPLSPLSPTLTSLNHQGSAAGNGGSASTFSFCNQTGGGSGGGGISGGGPYQGQYAGDGGLGGQYTGQTTGMFPSMSVNVSMSMNVGMAPNDQHWGTTYHSHPQQTPPPPPSGPVQYTPTHGGCGTQSQYPAYSPTAPPAANYHSPYPFSDLRNPSFSPKDVFYRNPSTDAFKTSNAVPRFYSLNPLSMRRAKVAGRVAPPQTEAAKVNLCRICGKTYARPSTLKTHMRTHSGEKPYRCSTCNKSFSQAANLTAHVRTHSGEKPFRCPVCERRFSQSSSVTTHMRTHSGERPYRCRMCKKAFSDSSTLTKHLRIHSGEKPYQCKLCLLRFSQSGNLNRHMRVHTNSG